MHGNNVLRCCPPESARRSEMMSTREGGKEKDGSVPTMAVAKVVVVVS